MSRVGAVAFGLACLAVVPAQAQTYDPPAGRFSLSEMRGGVFLHQFIGPRQEERSASVNFELLFNGPWARPTRGFLDNLASPRIMLGGTLNTAGKTSFVYTGLDWNFALTDRLYLGTGIGIGASNGETHQVPGRIDVGCSVGGFLQANLAYRVTERWSAMATVQHISNGGLCEPNHGINTLGVRAGYRF